MPMLMAQRSGFMSAPMAERMEQIRARVELEVLDTFYRRQIPRAHTRFEWCCMLK